MRRLLFTIALATAGTSHAAASEQRYQPVQLSPERSILVDTRTIYRTGDIVMAWVLYVTPDATLSDFFQTRDRFDCRRRTSKPIHVVTYRDGEVSQSEDVSQPEKLSLPSSNGELVLDYVCNGVVADEMRPFPLHSLGDIMKLRDFMKEG